MKPSSSKKTFGIISYFPNNDSAYHIEMRRERSRRFKELLFKIEELWPDIDIMVIAQNWQDFELPELKNKITTYHYEKLGILGARRELRKRFLASDYDCLIMMDDDGIVDSPDPQAYIDEIDKHPGGIGAIRKKPSPLFFLAISKEIYNQIDMPDIDAEKGQGFEDDIFTATCFAKFPDKAYMFPEGIVTEKSFRYDGPGKCPSTWAKERKYDWEYMRAHTKNTIYNLEHMSVTDTVSADNVIPSVDLLITYVNGSDQNWIRNFIRTTKSHNPPAVRYRSWGTLKYLLRGVEKYMPFIRNVVLIVSQPSQVPSWVNEENVRIVYHKDFIPEQFLPTFNSCTIESFFWNIPDLSDRVIYFNDDMFPINMLQESEFFTDDTPHIQFTEIEGYSQRNIFRTQCRSGIDLITKALKLPIFESGKIIRPYHISTAITKKTLDAVGELCKDTIPNTITTLRAFKNVNQYIYAYYNYFTNNYISHTVNYKYLELTEQNISLIQEEILNGAYEMICLNDSDKLKNFSQIRYLLQTCFEKKYPIKSKYEI